MSYYPCPVCRQSLTWVPQYSQYYCYYCQKYFPPAQQQPTADQIVVSIDRAVTAAVTTPVYPCNVCGSPLQYVQQYQRWYCARCTQYK